MDIFTGIIVIVVLSFSFILCYWTWKMQELRFKEEERASQLLEALSEQIRDRVTDRVRDLLDSDPRIQTMVDDIIKKQSSRVSDKILDEVKASLRRDVQRKMPPPPK